MNNEEKYKLLREAVLQIGSDPLKGIVSDMDKAQVDTEKTDSTITKKEIMAIYDPVKRQAAIKENIHLFENGGNN